MWLSKRFNKTENSAAETGIVTLNSNGFTEAAASMPSRNRDTFSPYGYCYCAPVGEEVLIVNGSSGTVFAGTKMGDSSIEQGEIEIKSLGGACITLKNDGSVIINGLVIDKNGKIDSGGGV